MRFIFLLNLKNNFLIYVLPIKAFSYPWCPFQIQTKCQTSRDISLGIFLSSFLADLQAFDSSGSAWYLSSSKDPTIESFASDCLALNNLII